jgi:hypothetical protein
LRSVPRSLYAPITLWLLAVAAGWWSITAYDLSTEQPLVDGVAAHWPASTSLEWTEGRPTLLLFLHPKCPCSRASLAELERVAELVQGQGGRDPELIVIVTVPATPTEDWLNTATVNRAKGIPNARLFIDRSGVEAQRFGAVTSGLVMLYDGAGTCAYAGGVTIARGHEGENAGRLALVKLLKGEECAAPGAPVFGCRLCLPKAAAQFRDGHAT